MAEADIMRAAAQGVLIAWAFVLCVKTSVRYWMGEPVRPGIAMLAMWFGLMAGVFIGGDDLFAFLGGLVPRL